MAHAWHDADPGVICMYVNTAYNCSGMADPTGTNGRISADPLFIRNASPGPDGR